MNCLTCKNELKGKDQKKFCSRSCSAKYNNVLFPKRSMQGICNLCSNAMPNKGGRSKICSNCKAPKIDLTKHSNQGTNPYIRSQSRKLYLISGRPLKCLLCGYDKHIDICHIKDVRTYPDGTLYSVINHESNLIALCKNHHWEFDHDLF